MIVIGLYQVLWGKHKEQEEETVEAVTEVMKCCGESGRMETVMEEGVETNDIEMQKGEVSENLRVAIKD